MHVEDNDMVDDTLTPEQQHRLDVALAEADVKVASDLVDRLAAAAAVAAARYHEAYATRAVAISRLTNLRDDPDGLHR